MQNQHLTEEELLKDNGRGWSESEYRAAIDSMVDVVHMVDADMRFVIVNQAFKYLNAELGLKAEAVGLTLFEIYPFLPSNIRNEYLQVFKTGKPIITEEHHILNGKERFVEVRKLPVFEGRKVINVVTIIRDFVECKKTEEELRKSEELFRTIVDFTYDWEYWLGPDKKLIYTSPSCEHLTGYSQAEFQDNPNLLFDIIHPDDRNRVVDYVQKLWESSEVLAFDFRIVKRDGQTRWIGHICQPVYGKNGEFLGRRGNNRDITDHKEALESLEARERFLSSIFSSIQDGLSILDNEMNIIRVNPTLENWYAHAMPLVGKKCYEAYHGRNQPCEICPSIRTLTTQEASYEEVPRRGLGGEIVGWLDLFSFPLFDTETGKIQGVIEYVRDITDRKKSEQEVKHLLALERLIASISTSFVYASSGTIDERINHTLQLIGEFCAADRSYIFQTCNNQTTVTNTYEWCVKGIEPQIHLCKEFLVKDFPWLAGKIKKLETVHIPSLFDLPLEADAEKKFFQNMGVKSVVLVPLAFAGETIGLLGFDSARQEKAWSDEVISLLKIVAEILANALEHSAQKKKLDALNKELLRSNMRLKKLVLRDSHTGLFNHRYLGEIIEVEFYRARRYATPLSIIMLDIDYFKSINDVYGHQFGDLVLKQFAKQLKRMLRQYDIIIRYGGEEFVIVSPGIDKATALQLAQRLLDAINIYNFGSDKHIVKLKLSMAIASHPEDKQINKGMDLIELADQILNKAKEYGGNRAYSSLDIKKESPPGASQESSHSQRVDIKFLKSKIEKLTKRANQSLIEAILAFAKTIELKDHYTGEHVEKTVHYAREVAKALSLSQGEIERIGQASILHDLGKIGISEKILLKKSKLTKKEFEEIKKHPQIGVDIIRPIQFLHGIIPFLLYHHERWDGKGYPHGLKGEEVPIGARIVAIADVYQSLTSQRPYRKAYSKKEAIEIIKRGAGTQFDPKVVKGFLSIILKEK